MTKKGNNISLQELGLKIYHNMKKQEEKLNKNNYIINRFITIKSSFNSISIFIYLLI